MTTKNHTPNSIPIGTRIFNLVWGIGLLVLAIYTWSEGTIRIPGKGASSGMTFTGDSLVVFICAAVVGAINLFITIADHYDTRDNENLYKQASFCCSALAIILVIVACAIQYSNDQTPPVILSPL
jgi:hypothetical protein